MKTSSTPYYKRADVANIEANVPAELRELPVWLLWKEGQRGQNKEKPPKIPFYATGKARGSTDTPKDRSLLVSFADARQKYDDRYSGLGIALGRVTDTTLILSGIDLDRCVKEDRSVAPAVEPVIAAAAGAYTEISPGQHGLKIFGTGDIGTEDQPELEIYSGGRFFTITGEQFAGDHLGDLTEAAACARQHLLVVAAGQQSVRTPDKVIFEGGRNTALFNYICRLRALDTPEDDAKRLARALNATCAPPFQDREVDKMVERVWRRYPPGYPMTDLGNMRRLVDRHGEDLLYMPERKRFLTWMGTHWAWDRGNGETVRRAKDTVRSIFDAARDTEDADVQKRLTAWALTSQNVTRIRALVELAQTEEGISSVTPADLDGDPMLLGVGNGVIDLCTGALRAGRRKDYITQRTKVNFDQAATAPQWQKFLADVVPDAEQRGYVQRAVGYCLTGRVDEQCLFILFGSGANGKSVFMKIIEKLLGDYATTVATTTWMRKDKHSDRPPNDVAALQGKRLALSPETEQGQRLSEVLIKQATGGDTLSARFLYGEFFSFVPQFKIWVSANHKPIIEGDDDAIWRRVRLLPFTVTIPEERQDKQLVDKLTKELPGILAWAVEGCLAWQKEGLGMPECVRQATSAYRSEMDDFGSFMNECCHVTGKETDKVGATVLYLEYKRWMEERGTGEPWKQKKFGGRIGEREGVKHVHMRQGWFYTGVRLRVDAQTAEAYQGDAERLAGGQEIEA
jgi:putative DNA primase/helicase